MVARPSTGLSTLAGWLAWQTTLNPKEIDLGLSRVHAVLAEMPLPHPQPTVITVAGTNGKGSTVAFLDAMYRCAGYTVGCFTSPHLIQYNERIRINGRDASDLDIVQAFELIDAARQSTPLTFFEFGTLAAWYCLCQAQVDIAILEVGLGGRLDAVNAIEPDVAVVTTIALDHVDWLGDNRYAIGREKAGIYRPHKPAICGDPNPPASVAGVADDIGAVRYDLGRDFGFTRAQNDWAWWGSKRSLKHLPVPGLVGEEQYQNAATALQVVDCLNAQFPVKQTHCHQGLVNVQLPGRFQIVQRRLPIILDVAHNPAAAQCLGQKLQHTAHRGQTIAVFGVMQDKDVVGIVSPLADVFDQWYVVAPSVPRAMERQHLSEVIQDKVKGAVRLGASIQSTVTQILVDSAPTDRLVIFGSFFTVAEGLSALKSGSNVE